MGLFPYVGMMKPTDKLSLKSSFEDLEEFSKKHVDPLTGMIYAKDVVKAEKNQKERFEDFAGEHSGENVDEDLVSEMRELQLDDMPSVPTTKQITWLQAQAHLLKKQSEEQELSEKEATVKTSLEESGFKVPDVKYVGGEVIYDVISTEINKNLEINDMADLFLKERAMNVDELETNPFAKNHELDPEIELKQESEEKIQANIAKILQPFLQDKKEHTDEFFKANPISEPELK